MKTKTIEVVETMRGLPGANEKYPDEAGDKHKIWKRAEERVYEIRKLTNTVEFTIGQRLEKREVEDLCADKHYKVVVTKPKP